MHARRGDFGGVQRCPRTRPQSCWRRGRSLAVTLHSWHTSQRRALRRGLAVQGELYSCSTSSRGTAGRSWVAIRRPDAGAADSRLAIEKDERLEQRAGTAVSIARAGMRMRWQMAEHWRVEDYFRLQSMREPRRNDLDNEPSTPRTPSPAASTKNRLLPHSTSTQFQHHDQSCH